jgi:hypothetical protein
VKKFPAFYGTRNFISIYTKACQRSLPQTYWIPATASQCVPLRSF